MSVRIEQSETNQTNGDGDSFSPEIYRRQRTQVIYSEGYNPDIDQDIEDVIHTKTDQQKNDLKTAIDACFLFSKMDLDQKMLVIDAMLEKKVEEGEIIMKQGEDGENFYVVNKGIFNIITNGQISGTYTHNNFFGELALMYNISRSQTVIAKTSGSLFVLDRHTFKRIVLRESFKKRQMYENLIAKVPMLKELNSYEKVNIADALIPRRFNKNDVIVKQGDPADGMYFIEFGEVNVCFENTASNLKKVISTIKSGDYFGELALVTKKPRALTVIAVSEEVKCAFLSVEAFERLLGPCMEIMKRNIQTYKKQLADILNDDF